MSELVSSIHCGRRSSPALLECGVAALRGALSPCYWTWPLTLKVLLLVYTLLVLVSFDLSKAFDKILWGLLGKILEAMAMPSVVLRPYMSMLRHATRRYKLGVALDDAQVLYGGVLQGCPLAMLSMNALVIYGFIRWAQQFLLVFPGATLMTPLSQLFRALLPNLLRIRAKLMLFLQSSWLLQAGLSIATSVSPLVLLTFADKLQMT